MYPKKESFPLFPFHPAWNLPWKHLVSFRLQQAFCAQKTWKVYSLLISQLPLKPFFILHNQNAGTYQAVFIPSVNCHIYKSVLVLLQSTKEQLEKALLGSSKTFVRYKSTIIKYGLFGGKKVPWNIQLKMLEVEREDRVHVTQC